MEDIDKKVVSIFERHKSSKQYDTDSQVVKCDDEIYCVTVKTDKHGNSFNREELLEAAKHTEYIVKVLVDKMKARITFKDVEMADAFVAELKASGFRRAAGAGSSELVDDSYYQNGADVTFLWSTIYHDCFK